MNGEGEDARDKGSGSDNHALEDALRQLSERELDEIMGLLTDPSEPSDRSEPHAGPEPGVQSDPSVPSQPAEPELRVRPEPRVRPAPRVKPPPRVRLEPRVKPEPPVWMEPITPPSFVWPEPEAPAQPSDTAAPELPVPPEPPVWPEPESAPDPSVVSPEQPAAHLEPPDWPEPDIWHAPPVRDNRLRREFFEWVRALVAAIIFVSVLSLFFVRIIGIVGDSMNPTLEDGQKLLISNLFYRPSPKDIVIFAQKDNDLGQEPRADREFLVKRVIATEGQTVDIDFTTGEVRVDGDLLVEPYIRELTMTSSPPGEMTYHHVVSEGMVFVMGDNRNHSTDSRAFGSVDERYVLGRVLLRVWPLNAAGRIRIP